MRPSRHAIAILAAALLVLPALAGAQEPVRDFSQLNTRLKPGDKVWVTDAQGREVSGKIQVLSPDAITLKDGGGRTFAAGDVRLIVERRGDSLGNGALIGLGVGGLGIGLACLATVEGSDMEWCAMGALVYGAVGAGIGVGIDAMIPGKKLVTYRAPGAAGTAHARLSVAPLVTPRAKGVALSIAF